VFYWEVDPTMKTLLQCSALFALGVVAANGLCAKVEPLKIEATVLPQYSPIMQMDGTTEGKVVLAIDVSAKGELTDVLVVGYTHPALVRPCVEALKEWRITPARLDGIAVPVQTELAIDFKAEGVVISHAGPADYEQKFHRIFGYPLQHVARSANELDRPPERVSATAPLYAKEAEKEGVRGTVQVHFYIDETGAVRMPSVEESAHPYLAEVAVKAVRGWHFEPAMANGKPVVVAARQEFDFSK